MTRHEFIDTTRPFLAAVRHAGTGVPDVHAIYVVNPLPSALLQLAVGAGGHRSSQRFTATRGMKQALPQPLLPGEAAIADLTTSDELDEVDLIWAVRYCVGRTTHSAEFGKPCGWDECHYFEQLPVLGMGGYAIPRIEYRR